MRWSCQAETRAADPVSQSVMACLDAAPLRLHQPSVKRHIEGAANSGPVPCQRFADLKTRRHLSSRYISMTESGAMPSESGDLTEVCRGDLC